MGRMHNALLSGVFMVAAIIVLSATAYAQSTSPSYRVDEYFFGAGGELEACSDAYCAKQSLGETAVGGTESDNFRAQAGFNTSDEPVLEVSTSGAVDFGVLSTSTVASGSAQLQVRTYLASGYVVRIVGDAPTYSTAEATHSLASPSVPTLAEPGTEQFGINLRANTMPSVGADPVQVPDDSFGFGIPATDYNTPNQYMYESEAIVAYSNKSSGQTNYTISMIANMSSLTPAGKYTTNLSMVVTATF